MNDREGILSYSPIYFVFCLTYKFESSSCQCSSIRYLQYRENQPSLTDPHGTALSKVIVSCVYSVLIPHQLTLKSGIKSSSSSGSNLIQSGSKRTLTEADFITEFPQAKIRRLADTEKMSSSSRGD